MIAWISQRFHSFNIVPVMAVAGAGFALTPETVMAEDDNDITLLEPATPWHAEFKDEKCRLNRSFGDKENPAILVIEQYEPAEDFLLTMAGKPFGQSAFRPRTIKKYRFKFGPDGNEFGNLSSSPPLKDLGRAAHGKVSGLHETPKKSAASDGNSKTPAPNSNRDNGKITWLQVNYPSGKKVRLNLGSMGKPMEVMDACLDDLIASWGLDFKERDKLAHGPTPVSNPGKWLRSSDYPKEALLSRTAGLVEFRLIVDENGGITNCAIQRTVKGSDFERALCDKIRERAEIRPAMTKDGRAVPWYYQQTVYFKIKS